MIARSRFEPAWWSKNRHLQTLLPNFFRQRPSVQTRRERLELPDGDFVDIDWVGGASHGPLVIVLHGLEGSIDSRYAAAILNRIVDNGWRGALLHFRGCSGEPNRLERSYHSGDTGDFDFFLRQIREQDRQFPIGALGYSLGGNVLLKWLGETKDARQLLTTACAVSVPFQLNLAADAMHRGFARIYETMLLNRLKRSVITKFKDNNSTFSLPSSQTMKSIRDFDDRVTAPLNGFASAEDYYSRCSSRQFLRSITVPTLILHAKDDPFMTPETVPDAEELSDSVTLELSERGGHVGFVRGTFPFRPHYWLETRIPEHFRNYLK
ncbi:MAG: hydrolase [Gammaproteobacteria bacterium]